MAGGDMNSGHKQSLLILFCITAAAAVFLATCNGNPAIEKGDIVAQVATTKLPFLVRLPGETSFTKRDDLEFLTAGTTIRSLNSILALNVAKSVQVQLSKESELVLLGPVVEEGNKTLVLGLQKGEVRVNAWTFDHPVRVETPVGAVHGVRPHLMLLLTADDEGCFLLEVQANTRGITLSNERGSVNIPIRRRAGADEFNPPTLLPTTSVK